MLLSRRTLLFYLNFQAEIIQCFPTYPHFLLNSAVFHLHALRTELMFFYLCMSSRKYEKWRLSNGTTLEVSSAVLHCPKGCWLSQTLISNGQDWRGRWHDNTHLANGKNRAPWMWVLSSPVLQISSSPVKWAFKLHNLCLKKHDKQFEL